MTLYLISDPKWDAERTSVENLFLDVQKNRGGFEDLTEESLRFEIENYGDEMVDENHEFPLSKFLETDDVEEPPIDILETKAKILEQIAQTQQALLQAKDLVSLILSGQGSKPAELSLSPFVKQSVPLNSIKLLSVESREPTDSQKHSVERSGVGSKLEALGDASSRLLKAANVTEIELARENAYWSAFLKIKAGRWPVLKDPVQRNRLCVKYGFGDAAPEFKDSVHATLQVDDDNEITLDTVREHNSRLSARILSRGSCIATSSVKSDSVRRAEDVIDDLLDARDSIFDEELLFELQRESREYPSRGIKVFEKRVEFQLKEDVLAVVELENDEERQVLDIDMNHDLRETYSTVPDLILVYLRIMLTRAHEEARKQRTSEPSPLTERHKPRLVHGLLGPLLAQIEYKRISSQVDGFMAAFQQLVRAAKLDVAVNMDEAKTNGHLPLLKEDNTAESVVLNRTNWVERLFDRTESSLTIEFGLSGSKLVLSHRLAQELASYRISLQTDSKNTVFSETPKTTITPNLEHVSRVIHHILKLDVFQSIVNVLKPQGWTILNRIAGSIQAPKSLGSRTLQVDVEPTKITLELDAKTYRLTQHFKAGETYENSLMDTVRLWSNEQLDIDQIENAES